MSVPTPSRSSSRLMLAVAAGLTVVLWQFPPYGTLALYPFTLLATYAHEMGHGLTAVVLGGRFEQLVLHADGSGLAAWRGDVGRLGRALVAAGGLVGPSVAGAALLVASRRTRLARPLLIGLGLAMVASALWVAGSVFTAAFVIAFGAGLLALGRLSSPPWATFLLQLLGVQLCVALFQDIDYMFSPGGYVGGRPHGSDTAAMAEALLLPYWFWGGVTAAFSAAVLGFGLWWALSPTPKRA